MIPILFFLLTITVLGTVLYVYLRHEQDIVIAPKDKYDEAWKEFNKKSQTTSYTLATSTPRHRFFLLFYTFCAFSPISELASLFLPIIHDISNGASIIDNLLSAISRIGVLLAYSPIYLVFFPLGLGRFIMPIVGSKYPFTIGYIPYIVIFLIGSSVNNRRVFTFIYLFFIMLLIMNIAGCTQMNIELSSLS